MPSSPELMVKSPPVMVMLPLEWTLSSRVFRLKLPPDTFRSVVAFSPLPEVVVTVKVPPEMLRILPVTASSAAVRL